ncbi:hypothetical protein IRJ41_018293, partial [Triplophysa rosa]
DRLEQNKLYYDPPWDLESLKAHLHLETRAWADGLGDLTKDATYAVNSLLNGWYHSLRSQHKQAVNAYSSIAVMEDIEDSQAPSSMVSPSISSRSGFYSCLERRRSCFEGFLWQLPRGGQTKINEKMDPVEDIIKKALPMLQKRDYNNLLTHLTEDMKYVIPPIAGCRLIHYIKQRGHQDLTSGQQSISSIGSSFSGEPANVPIQVSDWVSSFEVPWEKMPPNLRQCLAQGQRPRKQEHLAMVRTIVDSIRETCLNPTRSHCSEIARRVTEKYPKSFADVTMEGELIGCGYGSLLNQIKTRAEHLNRDNTLVRVRRAKRCISDNGSTPSSEITPSKCSKTDSYGCINWQPVDLPQGETPESVELKREEMVKLFSQEGPRAAELGHVEELMKTTYVSQRYAINKISPPCIDELKEQWPFLFMKRNLCDHFNTLTGIDINTRLTESLSTKGKKVLHFFKSKLQRWKEDVRNVLKDINCAEKGDIDYGVASMITLMAYYREKQDSLFLLADIHSENQSRWDEMPDKDTDQPDIWEKGAKKKVPA